jgi:hypothetical protein
LYIYNAVFPLQCHDPPLEDEDIPEGDWVCIKCYSSKPDIASRVTAALSGHVTPAATTRVMAAATAEAAKEKKRPQARESFVWEEWV